jgi:hypothetical protein
MIGDFNEGVRHELFRTDIPIAEGWMSNITINGIDNSSRVYIRNRTE